jgi:hypothetical protein
MNKTRLGLKPTKPAHFLFHRRAAQTPEDQAPTPGPFLSVARAHHSSDLRGLLPSRFIGTHTLDPTAGTTDPPRGLPFTRVLTFSPTRGPAPSVPSPTYRNGLPQLARAMTGIRRPVTPLQKAEASPRANKSRRRAPFPRFQPSPPSN